MVDTRLLHTELYRVGSNPLLGQAQPKINKSNNYIKSVYYGGGYRLRGAITIKATGQPLSRRVVLLDAKTMYVVGSQWSGIDGNYSFDNISNGLYVVLTQDYAGNYNAVIADQATPEPMP